MSTPATPAHATDEEMLPLPATATAILRLAADDRVGMDEMVETISSDSAILAEILRVANLAFVGASGEVTSLKQASLLLGFKRVAGIAATVALRSSLGSLWNVEAVRRCWLHNLASALTAEQMAHALRLPPDEVYSAALLHDIGRFALIVRHRGDYIRLLQEGPDDEWEFRLQECERFGKDHTAAGQAVLAALGLSEALRTAAADHHDLPTSTTGATSALTHVACRAATAMGFGARPRKAEVQENPFAGLVDLLLLEHQMPLSRRGPTIQNVVTTLVGAYTRAFG